MRKICLVLAVTIAMFAPIGLAQQTGPYKVLKTARVGGEGGWDYIYADAAGRRLYIPRRGSATHTPGVQTRLTHLQSRHARAGRRDRRRRRKRHRGRSEIRPRLHQQQRRSRCSTRRR